MRKYDAILTYEYLYDLYINKKLSSLKIAKMLKISKHTILTYLKEYDLNRQMQLNTFVTNAIQKDFLIGSVLGDGSFPFEGINYRGSFRHAENQKAYLEFKLRLLQEYCYATKVKESDWNKRHSSEAQMMYYFHTRALPLFKEVAEMTDKEAVHLLNKNSFAIWIMDDGTYHVHENKNYSHYYTLSVKRFSKEDLMFTMDVLTERFGLHPSPINFKNNTYESCAIYFPVKDTPIIKEIIMTSDFRDDILSTMSYKLGG